MRSRPSPAQVFRRDNVFRVMKEVDPAWGVWSWMVMGILELQHARQYAPRDRQPDEERDEFWAAVLEELRAGSTIILKNDSQKVIEVARCEWDTVWRDEGTYAMMPMLFDFKPNALGYGKRMHCCYQDMYKMDPESFGETALEGDLFWGFSKIVAPGAGGKRKRARLDDSDSGGAGDAGAGGESSGSEDSGSGSGDDARDAGAAAGAPSVLNKMVTIDI